jgi:2-keto-4-pentenoate hydratase
MEPRALEAAIEGLWSAARRGVHCPAEWIGRFDTEDAYRVQLGILARLLAAGERQAGWKVGLTSKAVQQFTNFHEPAFGYLLESGALASGAELPAAGLIHPAIEPELCLIVNAPLQGPGVTRAQARAAIAAVAPALELVELRSSFKESAALALADNLSQKRFVTGASNSLAPDFALASVQAELFRNGERIDGADGGAVLGDPAESLAWLANKLATFGRRIEAGQRIMSGSFTRPHALAAGEHVEARFEPIGTVDLRLR